MMPLDRVENMILSHKSFFSHRQPYIAVVRSSYDEVCILVALSLMKDVVYYGVLQCGVQIKHESSDLLPFIDRLPFVLFQV